jgi:hypothetical protein
MRVKSVTERYRAVNEGTMSKKEFVRQMRQQYPMHVTQFNGFDDSVQILKNRGLLFETKKEVVEAHVYDERPALNYSLDALDRAIRIEIQTLGLEPGENISAADFKKAEKKAKKNLEKNPTHYLDLMSGESKKVDKHDKMKETKRGAKDADTFNAMKKATLKEGYTEEQIEAAIQRIKERKGATSMDEAGEPVYVDGEELSFEDAVYDFIELTGDMISREWKHKKWLGYIEDNDPHLLRKDIIDAAAKQWPDDINPFIEYMDGIGYELDIYEKVKEEKKDIVKEAGKTALIQTMNNAIAAIKGKYGEMPGIAGIIRDFLKTHIDDLADGADPLDEFENYVDANYDSLSETEETVSELDGTGTVDALTAIIGAGGLTGGAVVLSKLMDALEAGKLGDKGKAVAKHLRDMGSTFSGQGAPMKEGEVDEFSIEDFKEMLLDPEMGYEEDFPSIVKYSLDSLYTAFNLAHNTKGYDVEEFLEALSDDTLPMKVFRLLKPKGSSVEEKKGKDHDGDGDIDSDDYMAAKDKAIKNAMSEEAQIKEAVKTLIRKALTEESINEAATGNLSKFSDDYADFAGMTQIINQLENLVTDVEGYYAKTSEKLQKIFDAVGNVTNEEGLKVGGFIAPAIESAFKKDIQPVVKRGFMNAVQIPTIKQISSADIDRMRADQGMAEEEMEEKQTMFTPVMETKKK